MNIYRVCDWICPERRESPVTRDVAAASRGTVPNRTVQYRTILCLTLQQEHTAKHILPCLSQRKPGGKKAAVGNRRKCGKLCGKLVSRRSDRCGRARARLSMGQCRQGGCAGAAGAFGRAQSGACFRPVRVWWTLLAGALWRPCGAGRGCSAGRAGWFSCREKKCLTSYAKAY